MLPQEPPLRVLRSNCGDSSHTPGSISGIPRHCKRRKQCTTSDKCTPNVLDFFGGISIQTNMWRKDPAPDGSHDDYKKTMKGCNSCSTCWIQYILFLQRVLMLGSANVEGWSGEDRKIDLHMLIISRSRPFSMGGVSLPIPNVSTFFHRSWC